ncbi:MAG: hypothetical protein R8M38_02630 [Mariprofundaceae bacterium]
MGIFDAIWRRRGRPSQDADDGNENERVYHITMTDRDYSDLLGDFDVAIKFWLPELVGTMLDQGCEYTQTTRSDIIRQNLFIYLYGRHDLWSLHEQRDKHYQLNRPVEGVKFSIATVPDVVPESKPDIMRDLGKSTEDLKVWIPKKMRVDLQTLADKASLPLSEMIREIIISILIGHTYLPARKEFLQIRIEIEEEASENVLL